MKIALLGYGTVGKGVVEVIEANKESIAKKAGTPIDIKYVLDLRKFPGDPINDIVVNDFEVIIEDKEVEIVAEAMGGVEPAYTFAKRSLLAGKSFVTSNKELVALHGAELLEIARDHQVNFLFEASVGGGIPIIRPINQCLTADKICEITGILNGTTNYILTKMKNENSDFSDVLKEAQELGYAERNPEADVEGYDACRKIAILASLAFGEHVCYQDISTEGITKISTEDMKYADKMGYVIKLLATCKREGEELFAKVAPMLVAQDHPLAMVNDVFNAIFISGNVIGDVMFYGRGAGKLPTASAVVADIVDAAKHKGTNIIAFWNREQVELKEENKIQMKYFIRMRDNKIVREAVKNVFEDKDIKIKEVEALDGEYAFVTEEAEVGVVNKQLEMLNDIEIISKIAIH